MTSAILAAPALRPRRHANAGRWFGWWMIAPSLAMLAANSIFPLVYALSVAFQSYQILIPVPHRFIGLRNFEKIFSDGLFWSSLEVTAWFIAGVLLLQFPIGFGIAVLLQRLRRHQDLLVTLLLIPTIISTSVAAFQWVQLFNYQFGPINYLLGLLHLPQPTWTANPVACLALPDLCRLLAVDAVHDLAVVRGIALLAGQHHRRGADRRLDRLADRLADLFAAARGRSSASRSSCAC